MRYVDLFCGMGSFSYSFERLGYECVMACDLDPCARETFEANFGLWPLANIEDVREDEVPDHDVLCAGFPCQPFSSLGSKEGFADPRGTLFFHVLRIVECKRPAFVVLENVPGLLHHDGGNTFRTIVGCLEVAGYAVEWRVLDSSEYGCAQRRKRMFIVGRNERAGDDPRVALLDFSEHRSTLTLSEALGRPFDRKFAYTIRCGGRRSGVASRHNWDTYRVGASGLHVLTIEECKLLQGFDPSFELRGSDARRWKMLGNTIPTVFTHIIGERLGRIATRNDGR